MGGNFPFPAHQKTKRRRKAMMNKANETVAAIKGGKNVAVEELII